MSRTITLLSITAFAASLSLAALLTQQPTASLDGDTLQLAKHGADDKAGDDRGRRRGGHGADDPAGHASLGVETIYQLAKHGADDPAGDDRGGRRGGRGADDPAGDDRGGHGADDGANHA